MLVSIDLFWRYYITYMSEKKILSKLLITVRQSMTNDSAHIEQSMSMIDFVPQRMGKLHTDLCCSLSELRYKMARLRSCRSCIAVDAIVKLTSSARKIMFRQHSQSPWNIALVSNVEGSLIRFLDYSGKFSVQCVPCEANSVFWLSHLDLQIMTQFEL